MLCDFLISGTKESLINSCNLLGTGGILILAIENSAHYYRRETSGCVYEGKTGFTEETRPTLNMSDTITWDWGLHHDGLYSLFSHP